MVQGKPVAFRFPDTLDMEKVDKKAEEFGMSKTSFVAEAIELMMNMNSDSFIKIKNWAKQLKAPLGVVLQNTTVKEIARRQAMWDVWGRGESLPEVAQYQDKETGQWSWIQGDRLFTMLYGLYRDEETQKKIKFLLEREAYGELTDEQRQFMIKNRAGKTWENSEEYRLEQEQVKEWQKLIIETKDE